MVNKEEFLRHLTGAVESLALPPLSPAELAALALYYERVVTLNESINLTALTTPGTSPSKTWPTPSPPLTTSSLSSCGKNGTVGRSATSMPAPELVFPGSSSPLPARS